MREEHLHALFLYTDFSALSTDFSSSFRAVYRGESLKSIKARNSSYHHLAKHLKELIMYFGVDGAGEKTPWDKYVNRSRGPFYCGMSVVLCIPQFAIRLNGPTSTSLHIEVAMRFGGNEGMIIQLNNEGLPAEKERHFDCEWLSAFPEESERLFMGGRYMLQLETVRIVETKNNYCRFLHAFQVFDHLLSGIPRTAKKADTRIVEGAVSGYLSTKQNGYHQFVNDTFRHFCAQKTHIFLRLWNMEKYIKNKEFLSLIMNVIKQRWEYSDVLDDDVNLFKPVMFELFSNVQELVIATRWYAFNLERMSQYAWPKALTRMTIEGMWLKDAFTGSVKQAFNDHGWKAEFIHVEGASKLNI